MSAPSSYSRLNFSPVTPIRSRSLRNAGGRRLMLGLTERHVRPPEASPLFTAAESPVSGLSRAAPILDRLNSPLTRFHD